MLYPSRDETLPWKNTGAFSGISDSPRRGTHARPHLSDVPAIPLPASVLYGSSGKQHAFVLQERLRLFALRRPARHATCLAMARADSGSDWTRDQPDWSR